MLAGSCDEEHRAPVWLRDRSKQKRAKRKRAKRECGWIQGSLGDEEVSEQGKLAEPEEQQERPEEKGLEGEDAMDVEAEGRGAAAGWGLDGGIVRRIVICARTVDCPAILIWLFWSARRLG